MSDLSERMIIYRAKNRLNQQELADLCGISKQTVYAVESGLQEPGKVTVAKIELVIGKEKE